MSLFEPAARAKLLAQVHTPPGFRGLESRLALSDGTRPATTDDAPGAPYESGARVPRGPWRTPSPEEFALLAANEPPCDYGRSVALLQMAPPVSANDVEAIWRDDPDAVERALFAPLIEKCEIIQTIACIGTAENPPDMETTTVDPRTRQRIGLHVDSWHGPLFSRRDRAPNRVSINVGVECRYFLFLPVSVIDAGRMLAKEIGAQRVPWRDPTGLGRMFMERFPALPVVRCRLEPWEAYVAPTENLVHDGSSCGQSHMDRHYTLLGRIRLR